MSLYKEYRKHKRAYLQQRNNAKQRDISWYFNYLQWWKKWCESGKWKQRGKKEKQYCMARFNDSGSYSFENTKIITNLENWKERVVTPKTRKKMSVNNMGKNNPFFGKRHNQESKEKIGRAKLGNKYAVGYQHTKEAKAKMSKMRKNNKLSFEHRRKLSLAKLGNQNRLGKKDTYETRMRKSIATKNSWIKRRTNIGIS